MDTPNRISPRQRIPRGYVNQNSNAGTVARRHEVTKRELQTRNRIWLADRERSPRAGRPSTTSNRRGRVMSTSEVVMELRRVDPVERVVVGVVAPYDEVSYLTPHIEGERIMRGAFARSIVHHRAGVPLLRNHSTDRKLGVSTGFDDGADGLVGTFRINEGEHGDLLLEDLR